MSANLGNYEENCWFGGIISRSLDLLSQLCSLQIFSLFIKIENFRAAFEVSAFFHLTSNQGMLYWFGANKWTGNKFYNLKFWMILFDTTDFFHKLYFYTMIYIFLKGKNFFYFIFLVVISFHLLTRCCKILSIIESKIVKQFFFKLVIAKFLSRSSSCKASSRT